MTYTQFIFVDETLDITGNKIENAETFGSFFHLGNSTGSSQGNLRDKLKLDPYQMISKGNTHELRPDIESTIPSRNPFSFTGTVPYFDSNRLRRSFGAAATIQIVNTASAKSGSAMSRLTAEVSNSQHEDESCMISLKAVKVGLAYRKSDGDGFKKTVTKKWREWCVVLTGSQLLFMVRDCTSP